MCYVAAYMYLLCALGDKNNPSASDIKKVLDSVGIETDDEKLDRVISELKGKDLEELIAEGKTKLASMPAGGAVAAGGGGAAAGGGAAEEEEKKEEEESEEESDDDMGFGLFD